MQGHPPHPECPSLACAVPACPPPGPGCWRLLLAHPSFMLNRAPKYSGRGHSRPGHHSPKRQSWAGIRGAGADYRSLGQTQGSPASPRALPPPPQNHKVGASGPSQHSGQREGPARARTELSVCGVGQCRWPGMQGQRLSSDPIILGSCCCLGTGWGN